MSNRKRRSSMNMNLVIGIVSPFVLLALMALAYVIPGSAESVYKLFFARLGKCGAFQYAAQGLLNAWFQEANAFSCFDVCNIAIELFMNSFVDVILLGMASFLVKVAAGALDHTMPDHWTTPDWLLDIAGISLGVFMILYREVWFAEYKDLLSLLLSGLLAAVGIIIIIYSTNSRKIADMSNAAKASVWHAVLRILPSIIAAPFAVLLAAVFMLAPYAVKQGGSAGAAALMILASYAVVELLNVAFTRRHVQHR